MNGTAIRDYTNGSVECGTTRYQKFTHLRSRRTTEHAESYKYLADFVMFVSYLRNYLSDERRIIVAHTVTQPSQLQRMI